MKQSIESEPIRDCANNPFKYCDPSGHAPVGMSAWVISHGGTVSWNESTKTATATLNGHTETFNINNQLVINGRIIGDDQNLARAFGVNLSSSNGNAYTGEYSGAVYTTCPVVGNRHSVLEETTLKPTARSSVAVPK